MKRVLREWPTLGVLVATYALWLWSISALWAFSPVLAILIAGVAVAQHSSLQHEALHGHPFQNAHLNHLLVFPAVGFFYPYLRFRDTHLAHHHDPLLTDPYDDPESNYLDPMVWNPLPAWQKSLLRVNNTLLGRMIFGPLIGYVSFVRGDLRLIASGDRRVALAWGLHLLGLVPVLMALFWGGMPIWAWLISCYLGASLLKIRTFLEHRAHEMFRARTVVIEDRGPLALLFLNNNYHVVHHMHPAVPWYDLPALYRKRRAHFLRRNEAYVYRNYAEIFRQYFLRAKDPVPHPLMAGAEASEEAAELRPRLGIVEEGHAVLLSPRQKMGDL